MGRVLSHPIKELTEVPMATERIPIPIQIIVSIKQVCVVNRSLRIRTRHNNLNAIYITSIN